MGTFPHVVRPPSGMTGSLRGGNQTHAARDLLVTELFTIPLEEHEMTASYGPIGDLIMRMQGDYLDEPELTLTLGDALRPFGADGITCEAVLAAWSTGGY
jgi:hypothetical protein